MEQLKKALDTRMRQVASQKVIIKQLLEEKEQLKKELHQLNQKIKKAKNILG